jgi:hypothetical protein
MIDEARKWAEELANNEGEAFEQAMARIKPESDELQQAWRQGFIEGKKAHDKRIIEIAKHYGALLQREQFIEECSEAILAAQKSKRKPNPKTISDLQGEVADVLIMALQMRYLFGAEAVDRFVELKLARQIERIKEEEL